MLHLSGLVVFVVFCALSTACARGGAAPPSRRIGARIRVPVGPVLSRPPPLAHPRAVAVKTQPPSATAAAAAMRVCAGALVVFSLLLGLSTPSSAASASFNSATSSPPAPLLPPRLSYWDFNGRLQRLEDITFTKEDARKMEAERKTEMKEVEAERKKEMKEVEAERKTEMKEMALSGLLLITISAAILRQDTTARMDIMEAERKKEAKQLKVDLEIKEAARETKMKEVEAERKKEMKEMADTTQRNFKISSFLTVFSLFISLAANEGFTAIFLPPQE